MVRLRDNRFGKSPGKTLGSLTEFREALAQFAEEDPGIVSLESPQGNELLLGVGGEFMMAHFQRSKYYPVPSKTGSTYTVQNAALLFSSLADRVPKTPHFSGDRAIA